MFKINFLQIDKGKRIIQSFFDSYILLNLLLFPIFI